LRRIEDLDADRCSGAVEVYMEPLIELDGTLDPDLFLCREQDVESLRSSSYV
jgi:hypothetical protein